VSVRSGVAGRGRTSRKRFDFRLFLGRAVFVFALVSGRGSDRGAVSGRVLRLVGWLVIAWVLVVTWALVVAWVLAVVRALTVILFRPRWAVFTVGEDGGRGGSDNLARMMGGLAMVPRLVMMRVLVVMSGPVGDLGREKRDQRLSERDVRR